MNNTHHSLLSWTSLLFSVSPPFERDIWFLTGHEMYSNPIVKSVLPSFTCYRLHVYRKIDKID